VIVVKVELHSAQTGKVSEIGRMTITNNGSGTPKLGNYRVFLYRRGTPGKPPQDVLRTGHIESHPRLNKSVWVLVVKALKAVGFP
jgi:hypothetical protein